MASYSASAPSGSRLSWRVILWALVGLIALLIAEQTLTGWAAFGDATSIPDTQLSMLELVIAGMGVVGGLFALFTAVRTFTSSDGGNLRTYFDEGGALPAGLRFTLVLFAVMGVVCGLIAIQIVTGWIPLGERINIPRSNLNSIEWLTIGLAAFWAVFCLRTALGILQRQRPAWSWGQWGLLLMIFAGAIIFISGVFDLPSAVGRGKGLFEKPHILLPLLGAGAVLFLSALASYIDVVREYGDPMKQKVISGTLAERAAARDARSKRVPGHQAIRNRLSASPGAGAIIGFIGLFIFFSVATDLFLQPGSLASALTNNITRGIVAIGATMLMISGEFDLSIGSILGIGGLGFLGLVTGQFPPGIQPIEPITAALITLLVCMFFGWLNGQILIRTGIPSFIVTLATMLMLRGIPLVFIAGGKTLRYIDYFNTPPIVHISRILLLVVATLLAISFAFVGWSVVRGAWAKLNARWAEYSTDVGDFKLLGLLFNIITFTLSTLMFAALVLIFIGVALDQITNLTQGVSMLDISFFDMMNGRISSLPIIGELSREVNLRIGVLWWLILVAIFQFVLTQTRFGNATYAVGGNAGAARAQGINVNRIKISNYIIIAGLAGIASILDASRLQSIDALRGQGLEFEVIAATVIGGALLTGGYGSIMGALLGVFIFGMMQTGLVLIGIDARLFDAVIGAIILVAVIINNWSRRIR